MNADYVKQNIELFLDDLFGDGDTPNEETALSAAGELVNSILREAADDPEGTKALVEEMDG